MRRKRTTVDKVVMGLALMCGLIVAGFRARWYMTTTSLGSAIAAFNASAAHDPVGAGQPPVTEAEVIAKLQERPTMMDAAAPVYQFESIVSLRRLLSNQHLHAAVKGGAWTVELEVAGYPLLIRRTPLGP